MKTCLDCGERFHATPLRNALCLACYREAFAKYRIPAGHACVRGYHITEDGISLHPVWIPRLDG